MRPDLAYDWLAPKLSAPERAALESIYAATKVEHDGVFHPLGTPVDDRRCKPKLARFPSASPTAPSSRPRSA